MILAQQTAEELKANAQKEANLMLEESKRRIADMLLIYQEIIKRMNLFGTELKAQIHAQLEMLEKNQAKVEGIITVFLVQRFKRSDREAGES